MDSYLLETVGAGGGTVVEFCSKEEADQKSGKRKEDHGLQTTDRESAGQTEILQELQWHRDILNRLDRGQDQLLAAIPRRGNQAAEPVSDDEARRLFALLTALGTETNYCKAPVIRVFTLYCRDGKSRKAVARACHCSPALISLRLQAIERKLGRKAAELRQISDQFERMGDALSDSRARRIHRQSAMGEPEEDEEDG